MFDHNSYNCDPSSSCFQSSVVYLCTSFSQLVECHDGRLTTAIDLPFNDGVSVAELKSVTRSTLLVVQSRRNMAAVVDVTKHQVQIMLCYVYTKRREKRTRLMILSSSSSFIQ